MTTWSTICSSVPYSQSAEKTIPHLYQQERKRTIQSAEAVKRDPVSSWQGYSGGVGAGVGNENPESCEIVRPLRIPLVIRLLRRMYVVVVR